MGDLENISSEVRQAVEAAATQVMATHKKVADSLANYVNAAVSGSLSVGPAGGGAQGNIHYTKSGEQIYFSLEIPPTSYFGLFAGGGGLPLVGALAPDRLLGKTGTYKAQGVADGGTFQIWVDGQPVFTSDIPVVGAGLPLIPWGLEGRVKFTRIH